MAVELIGAIAGAGSFVLDAVKFLAAPIGRPFKYLYNYDTNFRNLEKEVTTLKNTSDDVQVKVTDAEVNVEEIKQCVKDWQAAVNKTITEAERLIQEKKDNPGCFKGLRPNCITRYKHSKKALKLKQDIVLKQEEKFDSVSYPTIPLEKNFDKLRDDVLKLRNARGKVQRKVEEAKNNGEEIEEDVKKWLEDVDSIIVKAEDLIKSQSSMGTDRETRCQKSKAASELMEDKIDPLLQQEVKFDRVSYPTIPLEKNFDKLRDDVSKLKNARLKVQYKITEAKNNVEEITEDVNKWLEDVDSIIIKAEELIENQSSIGTDWETRYRNSKAASELMVDNIAPLLQQEERFDKVSRPTIHKEIWLRSNEDYLAFESRNSTVKNVWDALQDEEIYMMGVYGMGGLGKTTLVQEIGRKADNHKLFDEIVFVEVTETPNTTKIQTIIANKLGLKFEDAMEDESQRASKLYSRIENKNILLIVDNIWEELDSKIVGIPSLADRGRNKILMTTRNVDVLEKMGSTTNFRMGILNEEEAWRLFRKMAGNVIQIPGLNSLPEDVCKECGGLPIVICTIAKALRNRRQKSQWEDALLILRTPSPTKFTRLLEKEYSKIKLSYDYLEDDELKKTFIILSLMENNTSILDLLKNIVGLGILDGANLTIEQARNRLDSVVKELKDSCLLLDGGAEGRFSMHDVVRIVALTCAYTDHHVFTERNDIENEWKDKDKLRECTMISLVGDNIITKLWPEALDCPKLEFLTGSSFEIPKEFFIVMPKLKVLNLCGIQQSLSSSLDLLTNLQTLCLDDSEIEDIAIIGKLKKLKVLSLRNTNIEELSIEMGQLTGLRILDLSNCWQLKVIAPNVISKLSQLEELYIKGCSVQWKVEVLEELKHLSQLTNLEIYIKDKKMVPKDFYSRELKRCNISIEDELFDDYDWYQFSRIFNFQYDFTISLEELRILKNVELLRLVGSLRDDNSLKPLFNEKVIFTNLMALELNNISRGKIWDSKFPTPMSSSYKNLTRFILESCGKIKYVFPSSIAKSLQNLQSLEIRDCEVLEEIVAQGEGAEAAVNFSFPQVTYLKLENLPKLIAFYLGIRTCEWPMLRQLVINECGKFTSKCLSFQENSFHFLEHKINHDLEVLKLRNGGKGIKWQSQSKALTIKGDELANNPLQLLQRFENLNKLKLFGCDQYKELFFQNLSNLEVLDVQECSKLMNLASSSASFQNLKVLRVNNCHELKKLITPSIARSLQTLQCLEIMDCEVLEEIVAEEEGAKAAVNFAFPQVTYLQLVKLPNLKAFYPGIHTCELPMLKRLVIKECEKFTSKYPSFQENSFHITEPKSLYLEHKINLDLEVLELRNGGKEITWKSKALMIKGVELANIPLRFLQRSENLKELKLKDNMYNELFFPTLLNLEVLDISCCHRLMQLITPLMAKSLVQLREMSVKNCGMLIEIVENKGDATTSTEIVFNNLKTLSLDNLESLTCFCSGNYSFNFPFLEELNIRKCPSMKTFSRGILSTPKLYEVRKDNELNTPIQQAHEEKVSFALVVHNLPKTVVQTLNQGSYVMSMDFHPQQQTILLVGTNIGDISLWEVGSRERLAHRTFKVWDISATSMPLQEALLNDATIRVNRCVWRPDGLMLGVAFSKHIVQIYTYNATGELRQHLEIDAHVGGVNDIAFARPNKQLCIVTCGDDKTIKVWDAVAGRRQYTFEGHEAPVYSVCPYHKENIQFIFSTAIDGTIKYWLYDCLRSRVDYDAPGRYCTMMAYSADGTRLFSCGTSEESYSYLVEWNESEGAIKRTYHGLRESSLGVVQFDTTRNRFLAAGDEFQIKFWDMDNKNMLTAVDADGGLPGCPRLRFNKEGSLLAVTTSDNGIKILANSDGFVSINSLGPMDSSRLVDVKPCIADDRDKVKSWNIRDVSDPSQMKALRLPDSIAPSKVVRLIYTNSGQALLALTASAVHKLWKWHRSERDLLGKATAYVVPQLWQPPSGTLMTNDINDVKTAEESAACIALSKNDSYIMSASGGKVSLFNRRTFKVMAKFMPPPPAATYLAFYPQDNNIIAIGMEDSTIQIYNVRVDEVKTKLKGHQNRITGLAFSQTLNALVSSGADAQLCMWSIDNWKKLKSRFIQAPAGRQSPLVGETKVQFRNDQTHLLVVHDSQISIYDSKLECSRSWSPKDTLPAPISSAIYSCDGLLVYAGFCDGAVGVFDADNLRLRCRIAASAYIPSFSVNSNTTTYPFVIAAHPSEPNQIALGMSDGAVHVVEPSDAELKWGGTPSQDNGSLPSNSSNPSLSGQPSEHPTR